MSRLLLSILMLAVAAMPARAAPSTQALLKAQGEHVFKARCATCHDVPGGKAPSRAQLGQHSVEEVAKALLMGPMVPMAKGLSMQDIGAVATYVSQKADRADPVATANMCAHPAPLQLGGPQWNGWGNGVVNARYQGETAITAGSVGRLKLKWAFSYPGAMVYGQPVVMGGRVFVTSVTGRVQALDARTGCTIWTVEGGAPARTAMTVAQVGGVAAAFFGDENAMLHAVNADTGAVLWTLKVDAHPAARITGAPVLYGKRLYVPVASSEEVGASPPYQCCSFRGSVVAVDAATGQQVWKAYTIAQPAKPIGKTADGTVLLGPAGASVWSAPTIDAKRGALYVGTSNSYTSAPTKVTDAIVAFSLADGRLLWAKQVTANDNFLVGCYKVIPPVCMTGTCLGPGQGECPKTVGPDHDFGASPILVDVPGGHRVLVAGQKSAVVSGLDPDQGGRVLWQSRVGVGGPAGGVEWGMAAAAGVVFAPSSDIYMGAPADVGGLTALAVATGKQVWHAHPAPVCAWGAGNCWGSQSQAVTASPGLVFGGGVDGHLRAFQADTGAVVWDFDAGTSFATVNQGVQDGGSLNLGGPALAGDMLFVNAGYGRFAGQSGHVLLAFGLH